MLQIHARKLAQRLLPVEQWKGIIAVSRGGLVPASLLARELGIRYVDTVCISSYDHDHQREMKVLKRAEGDGEGFVVIDDLVDTGGTAQAIRDMYPKARFCTIFAAGWPRAGGRLHCRYSAEHRIEQPWDMGVVYIPPIVKLIDATQTTPGYAGRALRLAPVRRVQYTLSHLCDCRRRSLRWPRKISAKNCSNPASNTRKPPRWCIASTTRRRRCTMPEGDTQRGWYRMLNKLLWTWRGRRRRRSAKCWRALPSVSLNTDETLLDTVIGYRGGNWNYEWSKQAALWQQRAMQNADHDEAGQQWLHAANLHSPAAYPYIKGDELADQAQVLANRAYEEATQRLPGELKSLTFPISGGSGHRLPAYAGAGQRAVSHRAAVRRSRLAAERPLPAVS